MPDLREDLGRLADFVGEPATLRDLETARRRRERRRRASALVVSLSVLVVLAVVAAAALRPRSEGQLPVTSPSMPDTVLPPASTTIWPENAINGTSSDDVQAALDAGDDTLRWRTDLEEVVQRFGRNILGRNMRILGVFDGDDGMIVRAFPCPPGEQPGAVCCDVMQGELVFDLVQPAGEGGGGIWSVRSVTSEPLGPLAIEVDPGSAGSLPEGSEISFDVAKRGPATSAHLGIVTSNGCSIRSATKDVLGDGTYTLQVPELRSSDPACAASPAGYAFLYVTDDTTLPSPDPMNEPTAIEFPWLTVVPFTMSGASPPTEPPASSAP